MLAQRLNYSIAFFVSYWRPLAVGLLTALVLLTAIKVTTKALKPGRTGEISRTAFLRWRPQIQALDRGVDIYRIHNYPNPPIMALILKPLTDLPPIVGMLAWFALKVLMAVAMSLMIFRLIESQGITIPDWGKLLAIALSLHPILGDLSHGNVNLFIAFLIVTGLDYYRRRYDFSAGLLIALAIACKITPALFIPYFLWKRAWKTLAGIGIGLILWWAVVPGLAFGFEFNNSLMASWFDVMVKPFLIDGKITSEHPNQSLPGTLTRLLTDQPSFIDYSEDDGRPIAADTHTIVNLGPTAVNIIVKLAMLAFAALFVWKARTSARSGLAFAAECSLIVLGMLLFSERTWKHHATTLLLPIATLFAAAFLLKSEKYMIIILSIPILSLIPSALSGELQDEMLVYGIYTILYIILLIGNMMILFDSNPAASPVSRPAARPAPAAAAGCLPSSPD